MTSAGHVPPTLRTLDDLWNLVRQRLDRYGSERRGTIVCPPLTSDGRLALQSLLGGGPPRRLDLVALEEALVARRVGDELDDALTALGHPPSAAAAERRRNKVRTTSSRRAFEEAVDAWPEGWAQEWATEVRRTGLLAGLDAASSVAVADDVRRFVDRTFAPVSRTELAASLYGDSHALDVGSRRRHAIARALRHLYGPLEEDDLWAEAGVSIDLVSGPALVWNLVLGNDSPLAKLLSQARSGALPLHLSSLALRRYPVTVAVGTVVYVVENPRLVEAAAERGSDATVVAANGNPSRAVTTLIQQLRGAGAVVRYHGDFDSAGLAMAGRMYAAGVEPWLMTTARYQQAVTAAELADLSLPTDPRSCNATPWDPDLADMFNTLRRVVHEELIIDEILAAMT